MMAEENKAMPSLEQRLPDILAGRAKIAELGLESRPSPEVFQFHVSLLQAMIDDHRGRETDHERRVSELLNANSREVERRQNPTKPDLLRAFGQGLAQLGVGDIGNALYSVADEYEALHRRVERLERAASSSNSETSS